LKHGILKLSAERIGDEVTKILALPNAAKAVSEMASIGVLKEIWPFDADISVLDRLKCLDQTASPSLGLAALFGENDHDENGKMIDTALRFSNAQASLRKLALKNAGRISAHMSDQQAKVALYQMGPDAWDDAILLAAAQNDTHTDQWKQLRLLPEHWTPPVFPVSGRDVLARNIEMGPEVARVLTEVENQWIAEGFPDETRVYKILDEYAKS